MGIEVQGFVDPALQRLVHDEVEGAEAVELEALDRPAQQLAELGPEARRRELRLDLWLVIRIVSEHRDVRAVALVAGAGMGDRAQRHAPGHVSMIAMRGRTCARST